MLSAQVNGGAVQHDDRRNARIFAGRQEAHPAVSSDTQNCSLITPQPGSPPARSLSLLDRYRTSSNSSNNSSGGGTSPSSSSDGGSDISPGSPRSSSSDGGSRSSPRRRLLHALISPRRSPGQRSAITSPLGLEVAPMLVTGYNLAGPSSPLGSGLPGSIAAGSSLSSGGSVLEVIKEDVLQVIREDAPLVVPLESWDQPA